MRVLIIITLLTFCSCDRSTSPTEECGRLLLNQMSTLEGFYIDTEEVTKNLNVPCLKNNECYDDFLFIGNLPLIVGKSKNTSRSPEFVVLNYLTETISYHSIEEVLQSGSFSTSSFENALYFISVADEKLNIRKSNIEVNSPTILNCESWFLPKEYSRFSLLLSNCVNDSDDLILNCKSGGAIIFNLKTSSIDFEFESGNDYQWNYRGDILLFKDGKNIYTFNFQNRDLKKIIELKEKDIIYSFGWVPCEDEVIFIQKIKNKDNKILATFSTTWINIKNGEKINTFKGVWQDYVWTK